MMMDGYLGEIRVFSFDSVPDGWARCDGQVLPIRDNQALFSLLGNSFGGDGQTTFALPDLRGKIPVHGGDALPRGTAAPALSDAAALKQYGVDIAKEAQPYLALAFCISLNGVYPARD